MPVQDLNWLRTNNLPGYDAVVRYFKAWPFTPAANVPATVTLPPTGNGTWYPQHGRLIGEGAQGLCHVYVCVDNNTGKVLDKVVVKHVAGGQTWYNNPETWHNGVVGGEPREHRIATAIYTALAPNDRKYMVEPRGYSDVSPTHNSFKLYCEYAPVGDLHDLIEAQIHTVIPGKKRGDHFGSGRKAKTISDQPFRESFLWCLFQGLAIAADAMERAGIVHADLQTCNVLFGAPDRAEFALWPVPKVHDFGSSRFINTLPPGNHRANLWGEPMVFEYEPPELSRGNNTWAVPAVTTQLSGKTNVWAVGCLMLCAMRLERPLLETDWRQNNIPVAQRLDFFHMTEPFRAYHPDTQYSLPLRDLVARCLSFDPANRPTAAALLTRVQADMVGRVENQDMYAPRLPTRSRLKLLRPVNDPYKIGKKPEKRLRR